MSGTRAKAESHIGIALVAKTERRDNLRITLGGAWDRSTISRITHQKWVDRVPIELFLSKNIHLRLGEHIIDVP